MGLGQSHQDDIPPELDPGDIEELQSVTDFSEEELHGWYSSFLSKHPRLGASINVHDFKSEYALYFPGGDSDAFVDSVFNSMDIDVDSGNIDFGQFIGAMSAIRRGALEQQIRWTFSSLAERQPPVLNLNEVSSIMEAVHKVGALEGCSPGALVEAMYAGLGRGDHETLTIEEFFGACRRNPSITHLLGQIGTYL